MTERAQALEAALKPFADYARARAAKPIRGLGDSVHAIHTGTEWAAEITLDDCERAREVLEAVQPPPPTGSPTRDTRRDCTCLGTCKGADGLGARYRCALEMPAPVSPVEPTPEPPKPLTFCNVCVTAAHCSQYRRCLAECTPADLKPTGAPAPCLWRLQPDGYLRVGCLPDLCIDEDSVMDYQPTHCLRCGHPLTVER